LLSSDHCYRFRLPHDGSSFALCHEYVMQEIDDALRSATNKYRLTEHDVIVANVGAHTGPTFTGHFDEFVETLNRSQATQSRRPLVIYRQTAPFHLTPEAEQEDVTAERFHNGATKLNTERGQPQRPCDSSTKAWLDSQTLKRGIAKLESLGVPVLHVGDPLRARYEAHVENGDCAHWCQPGPLSLFNDVLLTYLVSKLTEQGLAAANSERDPAAARHAFRWPLPASSAVLGPGWFHGSHRETHLAQRTYVKPVRVIDAETLQRELRKHDLRQLFWDPSTGEVLAVEPESPNTT